MPRARCCSTSARANGTKASAACSACRCRCCPRCATMPANSASPRPSLFGAPIRVLGMAGDQQAATVGQGCFEPGMMKSTYGTGCFLVLNTGRRARRLQQPAAHHHRLSARGKTHLCAGRRDLHRRRRGAVAARRAQDHQAGAGRQRSRRARRSGRAGLSGAGLCRAGRALLGRRGARRHFRADPPVGRRRACARRARGGRLPDPRSGRRHARRLAGGDGERGAPCCASTAA